MAKLPKKSTMKDTINRVLGYVTKLADSQKITDKKYFEIRKQLFYLLNAIDK